MVDGTEYGVGQSLCSALIATGTEATLTDADVLATRADRVVVLLPARPRAMGEVTSHVLSMASAVSADPRYVAAFEGRIVLAWYATAKDRLGLCAPRGTMADSRADAWNAAPLLLGTAWRRELRYHGGDAWAAARCRSDRVARLMHAGNHTDYRGTTVADLCSWFQALDNELLHALSVELTTYTDTGPVHDWTGATSIAAALMALQDRKMSS